MFNLLDARGAISVSERVGYIGRVRKIARRAAQAYAELRAELGYPLIKDEAERAALDRDCAERRRRRLQVAKPRSRKEARDDDATTCCSRSASRSCRPATCRRRSSSSSAACARGSRELRLALRRRASRYGTPRRLAVIVQRRRRTASRSRRRGDGPGDASVAFDAEGQPTQRAARLLRRQGRRASSAVRRVETPKGEYVAVTVHHAGKPAADVLPALLAARRDAAAVPQDHALGRGRLPLRPPGALAAGAARRATCCRCRRSGSWPAARRFGHRFLRPGTLEMPAPRAATSRRCEKAHVLADPASAARLCSSRSPRSRAERGGRVVADDELIDINNYLVEWPTAYRGRLRERSTSTCRAR